MPAPSTEEVKGFLAKETFKAKLDPELEEKDRKLIIKNLEKASAEVEDQPVSGGAFYAWKNLFQRTVAKLKKPFAALTISTVLLGGLAACSAGDAPKPVETTDGGTSAYSLDIGDGVGGDLVTDELGTYQKVKVDPNGSAYTFDESVVDKASFEKTGLTMDDARAAQEKVVTWLVEDINDNPTIDAKKETRDAQINTWLQENKERLYSSKGQWDNADLTDPGLYNYTPEDCVRDSKPRLEYINVSVNAISAHTTENGEPRITVTAYVDAGFRSKDESLQLAGHYLEGSDDRGIATDGIPNVVPQRRSADSRDRRYT